MSESTVWLEFITEEEFEDITEEEFEGMTEEEWVAQKMEEKMRMNRDGWEMKGWQVITFPYFHWCDFKGKVFDKPKGAILAVWRK